MNTKISKLISYLLTFCLANQAFAGNCTAMINDMMNWTKQSVIAKDFYISVAMSSNASNAKAVSYTTSQPFAGELRYVPGTLLTTEKLEGKSFKTYYNNRTYNYIAPSCDPNAGIFGCIPSKEPFNPAKTDKTRITISKNSDTTKANVSLMLGSKSINFSGQCDNGHIYGFKSEQVIISISPIPRAQLVHTLYDLTFTKLSRDLAQ